MARVREGDTAPDFRLPAHTGEEISLSSYRGESVVVLFFYPKDGTPVCTKEACVFRDAYEDFVEAGAVVIGVSDDAIERHRSFASEHRLPFLLVSDEGGTLRKAYGVQKTLGILPGRTTYVIDKQGVIRLIFNSQLAAERHVAEALKTVQEVAGN